MSSRNLKLACRILEVMDKAEIKPGSSDETIANVFSGFHPDAVEMHFRMLCQSGFILLDAHEHWTKVTLKWHPLSWAGFDLLEKLQKELQD